MSTTMVTDEQAFDIVRAALARVLELDPQTITRDTSLITDLQADSLALVETVELVEGRVRELAPSFTINDDDVEDWQTVGDTVAYVLKQL